LFKCDCPPYDCAAMVDQYSAGKRTAGDDLARKFRPLVWRIVQRVLGHQWREEWEDASQAIFLRIVSSLNKWSGRGNFCHWLKVVAARKAIDIWRGLKQQPAQIDPRFVVPDTRKGSHEALVKSIQEAVAAFPPERKRVLELRYQGVHWEEISRQAGKSVRTVQYWVTEMLQQLRDQCLSG